jgi:multicomponent Na+:H+ antiporter subunit C
MTVLAVVVFLMFFAAFRLLYLGGAVRGVLALLFLGNGANLMLFKFSGQVMGGAPIILSGESTLTGVFSDPLPQALILTAIVIGMGTAVYLGALVGSKNSSRGDEP